MHFSESLELSESPFLALCILLFVWLFFFASSFPSHVVPKDLRWFIETIRTVKRYRIDEKSEDNEKTEIRAA